MNVGNGRSFQWQIPQTTSAQSLVDNVSQQSADQLPNQELNRQAVYAVTVPPCDYTVSCAAATGISTPRLLHIILMFIVSCEILKMKWRMSIYE